MGWEFFLDEGWFSDYYYGKVSHFRVHSLGGKDESWDFSLIPTIKMEVSQEHMLAHSYITAAYSQSLVNTVTEYMEVLKDQSMKSVSTESLFFNFFFKNFYLLT